MVERFFPVAQTDFCAREQPDHLILLSGPPSSGKSSLLFQFAFNSAVEGNREVVFICNRRKLETSPPYLSQGIDPSSEVFQRIQMKYVEDDEGIKNYFAAFHLHDTYPVSVVIDDFADFFDERKCQERYSSSRGRDMAMVRVLALCKNAITHANEAGRCRLLISDKHLGNGSGSFRLRNSYSSVSEKPGSKRIAKYSIALQYLVLETITKDEESD